MHAVHAGKTTVSRAMGETQAAHCPRHRPPRPSEDGGRLPPASPCRRLPPTPSSPTPKRNVTGFLASWTHSSPAAPQAADQGTGSAPPAPPFSSSFELGEGEDDWLRLTCFRHRVPPTPARPRPSGPPARPQAFLPPNFQHDALDAHATQRPPRANEPVLTPHATEHPPQRDAHRAQNPPATDAPATERLCPSQHPTRRQHAMHTRHGAAHASSPPLLQPPRRQLTNTPRARRRLSPPQARVSHGMHTATNTPTHQRARPAARRWGHHSHALTRHQARPAVCPHAAGGTRPAAHLPHAAGGTARCHGARQRHEPPSGHRTNRSSANPPVAAPAMEIHVHHGAATPDVPSHHPPAPHVRPHHHCEGRSRTPRTARQPPACPATTHSPHVPAPTTTAETVPTSTATATPAPPPDDDATAATRTPVPTTFASDAPRTARRPPGAPSHQPPTPATPRHPARGHASQHHHHPPNGGLPAPPTRPARGHTNPHHRRLRL